jgi:excisionase family DNA binding protein
LTRDLAAELVAYLAVHPGTPTEEIAAALHARPRTVRELLAEDPRFVQVLPPTGRKPNARCWQLADLPVLAAGTGRDGQARPKLAGSRSETTRNTSGLPEAATCRRPEHEPFHWPAPRSGGVSDRLLTAAEIAELLSVPERWVRESSRSGRIPHIKLGHYVRFDRDDVLAWVEQQKAGGAPTTFRKRTPVPGLGTK